MSRSHDVLKGSGRSVPGVDLKEQLDHFHDRLLRYGGHAGAVGLTMAPDQLDRFADEFSQRLRPIVSPESGLPLRIDATLDIAECTVELLDFLAACEPFGSGNPQPVWMLRDLEVAREMPRGRRPSQALRARQLGCARFRDRIRLGPAASAGGPARQSHRHRRHPAQARVHGQHRGRDADSRRARERELTRACRGAARNAGDCGRGAARSRVSGAVSGARRFGKEDDDARIE